MMEMKMLTVLIVLAMTFHTGDSIHCYVCESKSEPGCHDLSSTKIEPRECTLSALRADNKDVSDSIDKIGKMMNVDFFGHPEELNDLMVCQKTVSNTNGEKTTLRACQIGKTDMMDPCRVIESIAKNTPGFTVEHCSTCDKDDCNAAAAFGASHLLFLPALLGALRNMLA